MDHFGTAVASRMADPGREIVGVEAFVTFDLHDVGMPDEEQMQRAPDRAGMHRLPKPVEHEHGMFKHGGHRISQTISGKLPKTGGSAIEKLGRVRLITDH
jgi:hypothetical protein